MFQIGFGHAVIVVSNNCHRLFKDGGCLSDGQG